MKYREKQILNEAESYIRSTYGEHYVGKEGFQIQDLLNSIGIAEEFCQANAIKYLSRYGKKKGKNTLDLMKAIHYTILLIHFTRVNHLKQESKEEVVHNVFADEDGDNKHYTMTVPKEPDQGDLFNDEDYASLGMPKCGFYNEDDQFGEGHRLQLNDTEENDNEN